MRELGETTSLPRRVRTGEVVYEDKFQRLYRAFADFDGFTKEYLVSDRGRRAAVLVVRDDHALLVRQYRLLINDISLEIPGGRVGDGESFEEAAVRECLEETGIRCRELQPLIAFQPGLDTLKNSTRVFHTSTFDVERSVESGTHAWIPLKRSLDMVFEQQIIDSLSVITLLAYYAVTAPR